MDENSLETDHNLISWPVTHTVYIEWLPGNGINESLSNQNRNEDKLFRFITRMTTMMITIMMMTIMMTTR